jgi:hypothetical protein
VTEHWSEALETDQVDSVMSHAPCSRGETLYSVPWAARGCQYGADESSQILANNCPTRSLESIGGRGAALPNSPEPPHTWPVIWAPRLGQRTASQSQVTLSPIDGVLVVSVERVPYTWVRVARSSSPRVPSGSFMALFDRPSHSDHMAVPRTTCALVRWRTTADATAEQHYIPESARYSRAGLR